MQGWNTPTLILSFYLALHPAICPKPHYYISGKGLVSLRDFFFSPHKWPDSYTVSHIHAEQLPNLTQKLNSHCRGNGTVTDIAIPHTDSLSLSMVSNWQPSQQKAIFPTLVPQPPKVGSFIELGGDVEVSFMLLFQLQKRK